MLPSLPKEETQLIAYVTTQGVRIEKHGRRLIVHGKDIRKPLFLESLEQLVLFGNVSLTTPAIQTLFVRNIDTVFNRLDGRFIGRLAMKSPANVLLRKRQFDLCDDQAARLPIAKAIVRGKILNQATLLTRIKRARNQPAALAAGDKIRRLVHDVEHAHNCSVLRGIEGRAAAIYFAHLHLGFIKDWKFVKRIRRPPTDPVNCILSFLYTMLTNRCYAAIHQVGLDPQPGILHELAYGRDSLSLDLVEEFRPLVGDTLTLALFNMNMLHESDFENPVPHVMHEDSPSGDNEELVQKMLDDPFGETLPLNQELDTSGAEQDHDIAQDGTARALPVLLTQTALKKVIDAFSQKMETKFFHPVAKKEMTYNEAMVYQARFLRYVIEGKTRTYVPLMLR